MTPQQALDRIRGNHADLDLVGELHHGLTSRSYLLQAAAQRFVMRVDEPLAAVLELDRRTEVEICQQVAQAGLGPAVVACDLDTPVVQLRRFVPGRVWTPGDLAVADQLRRLAKLLRRVHGLVPARAYGGTMLRAINRYARQLGPSSGDIAARAIALARGFDDPARTYPLCHNDALAENIVDGNDLQFIDWEYAAAGDPLFDLAAVIQHHDLQAEQRTTLVGAYLDPAFAADAMPRLSRLCELYDCVALLWLRLASRECGLTPSLAAQLGDAERRLAAACGRGGYAGFSGHH